LFFVFIDSELGNAKLRLPPLDFIYVIARNAILVGLDIGIEIDFYIQNQKHYFNLLKVKTAK